MNEQMKKGRAAYEQMGEACSLLEKSGNWQRVGTSDVRLFLDMYTQALLLRMAQHAGGMSEAMKRLIAEIAAFLGEPEPYEIERKFLIEYPDIAWLESLPNCSKIDVLQTYLTAKDGEERRIRQRGCEGHYLYFKTTKRGRYSRTNIYIFK